MDHGPPPADLADRPVAERAKEARLRIARHLAELHRLHLALSTESRSLKRFTSDGYATVEIELASELVEQYLAETGDFLENMRGRFEARLGLLRRGEPVQGGKPELAPGHGAFWMSFSRLCAALRRAERRAAT